MKINNVQKIIVRITIIFLALLAADCIVLGATAGIPLFTAGSLHVLLLLPFVLFTLFLMVLFVAHLIIAVISPRKTLHIAMLVLIPITLVSASSLAHKWAHYGHRRWFFETALPEYQTAVDKILRDPSVLANESRLQLLIGHPAGCPYIHGETKTNGSVVIYFSGGDHWREGYIYYSRSQMTGESNSYLTNGWFEWVK